MSQSYQLSDFDYPFDESLIAQQPLASRSASRLLTLDVGTSDIQHQQFKDLKNLLKPGDRLVLNNTSVIPARIRCQKITGGQCEILIERVLSARKVLAHMRANKSLAKGTQLMINGQRLGEVIGREGDLFLFEFNMPVMQVMAQFGEMPLPPYIDRAVNESDLSRYQTVFAKEPGAVAAPTAGLHFDEAFLKELTAQNIDVSHLTLHVGAGTFQPVRYEDLNQHVMHSEFADLSESIVDDILTTKKNGGRIIAVGTTVVRTLETAAQSGSLKAFKGDTNIFIRPGYQFKIVDALITNFHLPKTTLMMLVSAFADLELIKKAYQEAVEQRYRFFSYGDAMFIFNRNAHEV